MKYVHQSKNVIGEASYYFVVRISGKVFCRRGFNSEEDAFIAAVNFKRAPIDSSLKLTLDFVIKSWLQHLEESCVRETILSYTTKLKKYVYPFLNCSKAYIRITDAELLIWHRKVEKISKINVNTKNKILTIFKSINDYAKIYFNLDNNAFFRINRFSQDNLTPFFDDEDIFKSLTIDQMKVLLIHTDSDFFKLLFSLALCCGLRIGEVRGLTVDCVKGDKISIVKQVKGTGTGSTIPSKLKSKASRRMCRIPTALANSLTDYINSNHLRTSDYVFFSSDGSCKPCSANYINYNLHRIQTAAGLTNFRFHTFRHSASTILDSAGIRSIAIKDQLGHASEKTTEAFYIHAQEKDLEEIVDIFGKIIG